MLKIQVLGRGIMIPRGLGLAPRKEPFFADLTTIATIMSTPGLKVNMFHPFEPKLVELTPANIKRMYEKYGNVDVSTDTTPIVNPVQEEVVDEKKPEIYTTKGGVDAEPIPAAAIEEIAKDVADEVFPDKKDEVTDTKIEEVTEDKKNDNNDKKHGKNNSFKPVNNPNKK